ncbi:hypothetical protein COHA_008771 [Chlorella ohadii]|uniref:Uncharacterized protein n=1 Tax=Chlorella ohadii TaxID=2649997 RepID=A0AAD5DN61_9CHLO|nr:hypothetical protein COHA_008771 [Chlorella ohadii]
MKALAVLALLLSASACLAAAQEAGECGDLRSKLSTVEKRLAAAEASSASCTKEAGGLKSKLEQAEAAAAKGAASLKELQAKLEAAPTAAAIDEAKASAAAAQASLTASERKLSEATAKLEAGEKELAALKAAVQAAKDEAGSCSARKSKLEGSLKKAAEDAAAKLKAAEASQAALKADLAKARDELDRVRGEASASRAQLAELERLKAAWLPYWAEEATASLRAAAGPAVAQATAYAAEGGKAAGQLWQSHGKPALERGLSLAKEKGAQLNKAIEAKAGDKWPQAQAAVASAWRQACAAAAAAWGTASRAAQAVWQSEALAAVRPTLAAGAAKASAMWEQVQGELEGMLINLLSKNNNTAPLARRPYVTYMVYAGVLVPLVTFGLPLLGLRRAGPKAGESSQSTGSAPLSSKKKKNKKN